MYSTGSSEKNDTIIKYVCKLYVQYLWLYLCINIYKRSEKDWQRACCMYCRVSGKVGTFLS